MFGVFGGRFSDGMLGEQDRISRRRTDFAQTMANIIASNPGLTQEEMASLVDRAAGIDNTMRGAISPQFMSGIERVNKQSRVKASRIDILKALEEAKKGGMTPQEFQLRVSTYSMQDPELNGMITKDVLDAALAQGRQAQQQAQMEDQLRLLGSRAQAHGYLQAQVESAFDNTTDDDTSKILEQMSSAFGGENVAGFNLRNMVTPQALKARREKRARELLPKALELINQTDGRITDDMLSATLGIDPKSPILKLATEQARQDFKTSKASPFYKGRNDVVRTLAEVHASGGDVNATLAEILRGYEISNPAEYDIDTKNVLNEARVLGEKMMRDQEEKEAQSQSAARTFVVQAVDNDIKDPARAAIMSDMTPDQLGAEIRRRLANSGLTPSQINALPPEFLAEVTQDVMRLMKTVSESNYGVTRSKAASETGAIEETIRKRNADVAEKALSPKAIEGYGVPAELATATAASLYSLSLRYDLSDPAAMSRIYQILAENPEAGYGISNLVEGDDTFNRHAMPISQAAQTITERKLKAYGLDHPTQRGFTEWISSERQSISETRTQFLTEMGDITKGNFSPEVKIQKLQEAALRNRKLRAELQAEYQQRALNDSVWTTPNDRWNQGEAAKVLNDWMRLTQELEEATNKTITLIGKPQDQAPGPQSQAPKRLPEEGLATRIPRWFTGAPRPELERQLEEQLSGFDMSKAGLSAPANPSYTPAEIFVGGLPPPLNGTLPWPLGGESALETKVKDHEFATNTARNRIAVELQKYLDGKSLEDFAAEHGVEPSYVIDMLYKRLQSGTTAKQ